MLYLTTLITTVAERPKSNQKFDFCRDNYKLGVPYLKQNVGCPGNITIHSYYNSLLKR